MKMYIDMDENMLSKLKIQINEIQEKNSKNSLLYVR